MLTIRFAGVTLVNQPLVADVSLPFLGKMDEIPPVKEYQVTWLTSLLHSFPHLDLALQRVNSTFNLENVKYKEVSALSPSSKILMYTFFYSDLMASTLIVSMN